LKKEGQIMKLEKFGAVKSSYFKLLSAVGAARTTMSVEGFTDPTPSHYNVAIY
jgi:hypothetical protein